MLDGARRHRRRRTASADGGTDAEIPAVSPARSQPTGPNTDETHRTTKLQPLPDGGRCPVAVEVQVPHRTITTTADARLPMAAEGSRVRPESSGRSVNPANGAPGTVSTLMRERS